MSTTGTSRRVICKPLLQVSLIVSVVWAHAISTISHAQDPSIQTNAAIQQVTTLYAQGQYVKALELARITMLQALSTLGEKHALTATAVNNYAELLRIRGRPAEALPLFEQAYRLQSNIHGEQHPHALQALSNRAVTLENLGRTEEALTLHEQALKLRIQLLGEKHPDSLQSLNNHAGALATLRRMQEALLLYERSLALHTEVHGEKHPRTLIALNNYAYALNGTGRLTDAAPIYERSFRLRAEVLGDGHPDTLQALSNLAVVMWRQGRTADSLMHYKRALILRTETLGIHHPDTLTTLNNYAHALRILKRPAEAAPLFKQYVSGAEALREAASIDGRESQRGVLANLLHGYHSYLLTLHALRQHAEAFEILERTKARTLLEQMAVRSAATGSGLPPADAEQLVTLSKRIGTLDTRIAQSTSDKTRESLKSTRDTASRELAQLRQSLQQQHPRFRQIVEVRLATAADAHALIPVNGVFVNFVAISNRLLKALTVDQIGTVNWHDLADLPGLADTVEALRLWSANPAGARLVDDAGRAMQMLRWTADGKPRWRAVAVNRACSTQQLQQDARRFETRGMRGLDAPAPVNTGNAGSECVPPGAAIVSGTAQYQELVDYLGKSLIEPLKPQLVGKTQIIISPDGPLGLLPFDILPLDGKPLITQFEVSQVQSLSVLKLLKERQAEYSKTPGRDALLAMGNPEYGGTGNAGGSANRDHVVTRSPITAGASAGNAADALRNLKWAALPGTQAEMDQAAKIFAGQSRVISGKAANETTLRTMSAKGELANYRYLHFAAHGYFDPSIPAYSSLVLSPEGPEPERDGYVTIGEWVGMNLKSELTLLSACNTARGENVSGEGLMGLSYALYVAGNTNTVLTLWPVADEETAEFVSSLLAKIKAGQSHAQAITATKREFLNHANPRKRNPYFWAPFVLYGV